MHCATRLLHRLAQGGILVLLCAAGLCSATDLNTGTEAELDSIRGIGPATSRRILAERDKSSFRDWTDLMTQVKGIQQATAQLYTEQGATVNGLPFLPAPAPVTTPPRSQIKRPPCKGRGVLHGFTAPIPPRIAGNFSRA